MEFQHIYQQNEDWHAKIRHCYLHTQQVNYVDNTYTIFMSQDLMKPVLCAKAQSTRMQYLNAAIGGCKYGLTLKKF